MVSVFSSCPFCGNSAYNFAYCIGHRNFPNPMDTGICESFGVVGCCNCKEKFMVIFTTQTSIHEKAFKIVNLESEELRIKPIQFKTFPEPKRAFTNAMFPDVINNLIEEAEFSKNPAVKAMVCRSIVEFTLKDKQIGTDKDNLVNRINKAYEMGLITKPVAEWTHIFRKIGNKAVHEISVSEKEANEFLAFVKIFLELIYIIPSKVKEYST